MPVMALSFLLGCIAGLRSLTAPAAVCWAAHLGWLHLADSKLAFIGSPSTLVVVTFLALVELVVDKLPQTPARTAPVGLVARIVAGGFCGIVLATSEGMGPVLEALIASVGALLGAFAGYNVRRALVSRLHLPEFGVALAEDAIAITGALLIVSHM